MAAAKGLAVVGAQPARLAHVRQVLDPSAVAVALTLEVPAAAADHLGRPPAVVLLDAVDADVDHAIAGVALLDAAWPGSGVVVMHDDTEPAVIRSILDAGALSIVTSTTRPPQLRATLEAAVGGHGIIDLDIVRPVIDLYATLHAESRKRNRAVIESLAAAVEAKDTVTSRHLHAVTRLAAQLAAAVDPELTASDDFLFGCLLHDVGKIGVPERILNKAGPLSEDEWEVMRLHPETGVRVIGPLGLAPMVSDLVLHHHERWDGGGYPGGLAGDGIPLAARIFSVCDALEAMTARRPYRRPLTPAAAMAEIRAETGRQFDPDVVTTLRDGVEGGDAGLAVTLGEALATR